MNIAHLAKYYPPDYGGIESVTQSLAEDHAAAGCKVEVVCFAREKTPGSEVNGNLSIRRIPTRKVIASQPLSLAYFRACLAAAQDAEIVHVHAPNLIASLAVLNLPSRARAVVHWHSDIENRGVLSSVVRPIEQAMLRRADSIVATSAPYRDSSPFLSRFSDKIRIIPIGIADLQPLPAPIPESSPYLLFVGRLVTYKGLNVLIEALGLLRTNVSLKIVGLGPEEASLRFLVQRLGLDERVQFLGRAGPIDLQKLMSEAAIFVLPSVTRAEAFGVVLLEAMRAGLAVISTKIPGSGVQWVNSSGVSVDVNDPPALARAIDLLIADPEERARLGSLARNRFLNEFSRELMSERFMNLYRGLLSEVRA